MDCLCGDRESVMRGKQRKSSYNFIRPNQATGGQTPAKAGGINLNVNRGNRIESLMRQAAVSKGVQQTPIAKSLGIRAKKVLFSMKVIASRSSKIYGGTKRIGVKSTTSCGYRVLVGWRTERIGAGSSPIGTVTIYHSRLIPCKAHLGEKATHFG